MKKIRLSGKPLHDSWIILLIGVTIFGIITSRGLVISFGCIGVIVAFISLVWNKICLQNLNYYRTLSTKRAFVGETIDQRLSGNTFKVLFNQISSALKNLHNSKEFSVDKKLFL